MEPRTTTSAKDSGIPGYRLGDPSLPASVVTLAELSELKATLGLTGEDEDTLRASVSVLAPHVDELLDTWYGYVATRPPLLAAFSSPTTSKPDPVYMERVRVRFRQWVMDTAAARFDQAWLDYQEEIGRRHHRVGKNRTDDAEAAPHIPLRHILALVEPLQATMRPFFERNGASPAEVQAMQGAWRKAILLTGILWSVPYVKEGDW